MRSLRTLPFGCASRSSCLRGLAEQAHGAGSTLLMLNKPIQISPFLCLGRYKIQPIGKI